MTGLTRICRHVEKLREGFPNKKFRMGSTKYLREDHWERIKDSLTGKPGIVGCAGDKMVSEFPGMRKTSGDKQVDETEPTLDLRARLLVEPDFERITEHASMVRLVSRNAGVIF